MSNLATCLRCDKIQRDCAGPCACTVSGRQVADHAAAGDCPLGRMGPGGATAGRRPPLPIADLTGYDPYTDPQSPLVGGCCDPPKG